MTKSQKLKRSTKGLEDWLLDACDDLDAGDITDERANTKSRLAIAVIKVAVFEGQGQGIDYKAVVLGSG